MIVEVIQLDREAAASGYYGWVGPNPVIPRKMLAGEVDEHSMVQAFARHRVTAKAMETQSAMTEGHGPKDDSAARQGLPEPQSGNTNVQG